MDDELKRRIAASLDRSGEGRTDPKLGDEMERNAEARAYRTQLRTLDRALREWPVPARPAAEWERLAAKIDERLGESVDRPGRSQDWDPLEPPHLGDEPGAGVQSEQKAMSEPNNKDDENDDDLEGLAALTRTSLAPTSTSLPPPPVKPGPSLTEDGLDDSSGIVDLQLMAKQVAAKPAPEAKSAAKPAATEAAPAKATVATPAPNASVETNRSAEKATPGGGSARRSSPVVWMIPVVAAAAVGGFFALKTNTAERAMAPSAAQPESAPAAAPTGGAESPTPANAGPAQAQPMAQPTAVVPPPTVVAAAPTAPEAPSPEPSAAAPATAPAASAHAAAEAAPQDRPRAAREADDSTTTRHAAAADEDQQARRETPPPPPPAAARAAAPAATTAPAATPAPQPASPPAGGTGQPATMNDMMVRAMGGHGPGAQGAAGAGATAAPAVALPETPSRSQVTGALAPLSPAVRACAQGQTGTATVALQIASAGSVQNVSVSGPFSGEVKSCIQGVVRRAHFPQFSRPTVSLVYPFTILPPRPGAGQ